MSGFDNHSQSRSHLAITRPASEPQAVISWGEEILDRVHKFAHEIEEQVRQALQTPGDAPVYPPSRPSHLSRR